MQFDWKRAIELNRDDLFAIVTRLFVLAGIRTGRSVIMLPRALRIDIVAILRPAEFAVRRLIAIAACGVEIGARQRGRSPKLKDGTEARPPINTAPTFPLFDPFKPFRHPWREEGDGGEAGPVAPERDPDDLVDARAVCRRIVALEAALEDLEVHALRLARWRARRAAERATGESRVRPCRFSPFRPGLPPGWRKRPKTDIEEVLKECNSLALIAWAGPDPPG